MEEAEQRVFCDQLRADLEKCLDEIPDPEASALRAVYFNGNTLQQIAAQRGLSIERARQLKISGLRKMRYGTRLSRLKKYENEIISTQPWRGSGLGAYRVSGASSVEKTVERLSGLWADGA